MIKRISQAIGVANTNKMYMGVTTLCRALVGLSVYLVLTRMLGPTDFGFMMTALSVATLAALVTDFGFGWKALRDIGASPANARNIFLDALRFKFGMTILVTLVGAVAIAFFGTFASEYRLPAALFGLGVLVNGIGDLGVVGFRATGRFKAEAKLVLATSLIYGAAVIGVVLLRPDSLVALAMTFVFGRTVYAVAAVLGPLRHLTPGTGQRGALMKSAREGLPWAVDNALTVTLFQLDTVLLAHSGTFTDVGVYQSGGRILEHMFQLSIVLASVHVPILARSRTLGVGNYASERKKVILEFAGAGVVMAFIAAVIGPMFTRAYLGSEFSALLDLWIGFGALLFLRFTVGGLGAILTAAGLIRERIFGVIVGLIATLMIFAVMFPSKGLRAMPWIMCGGVAAIALSYGIALLIDERRWDKRPIDAPRTGNP